MNELNNNQIETLRLGLERAFVNFDRLDLFLQEKLVKRLNSYAGREDAFPIAIFKLITEGALAESWIEELVSKAYRAHPKNKNIAEIAAALGIEIELEKTQSVSERLKAIPNAPKTTLDQVERLISERTRQFFGRDDQLLALDRFVSENDRGVMFVTAPGGFGKSALLANWGRRQEGSGALVACHFFSGTMHRTVQPTDALKGLLYQISALRDGEPPDPTDDFLRLEDQLNEELCNDASAEAPLIVVLDGLDEGAQLIEPIMPAGLGKHVYFVASAREENHEQPRHIGAWLYAKNKVDYPFKPIQLKPLTVAGVMQWLHDRAPGLSTNAIARRIFATTEGIPLFLRFIVDDILQRLEAGMQAEDLKCSLLTLPAPFTDYAAQELDAMQKRHSSREGWRDVQRIFAFLTLIRGAMPVSEIAAILGVQSDVTTLDTAITRWFAIRLGETEASVAFLHPRLADVFHEVLARRPQTQGLVHQVARRLIDHCAGWQENGSLYGLCYLPWHLMQARRAKEALQSLTSVDFLTARLGHAHAAALNAKTLADFTALSKQIPSELRSVARSWLSFWATIEPKLLAVARGPRPEEAEPLLLQVLNDTLGAPNRALSQADRVKIPWRLLAGRRKPSNLLRTLEGHTFGVDGALVLSDDRVVSWSYDRTLRLWAGDGTLLGALEGHTGSVIGALALPDDRLLSWSDDTTLRIWAPDGAPLADLKSHTGSVIGALALPDDRLLSWSRDGTLRLWSEKGAPLAELKGHANWVRGALALADGRLLSWSDDTTLRLWSSDGGPLKELRGHTDWVTGALALSDGRLLSWSRDGTLRLWSPDGGPLKELRGHTDWVTGALALSDGRLLSWSRDGTSRLWAPNGAPLGELHGHTASVDGALALSDGRLLSWSRDDTLRLWAPNGAPLGALHGHTDWVTGALALPDGRLLSWSRDDTLRLWASEGAPLPDLQSHTDWVSGALALLDGRLLSWSHDGTLRLWSEKGAPLGTLQGHTAPVGGALALSDGRLLSWSDDTTLRLWSSDGGPLKELRGHTDWVTGALALSDGRLLSWSRDCSLQLWSQDGVLIGKLEGRAAVPWEALLDQNELRGHTGSVIGALALPDDRLLSWSRDGTLRLWSEHGTPLGALQGHTNRVNGALGLGDGRLLSWSDDGTLRLWAAGGAPLGELKGHTNRVNGALGLGDGRLLSWSDDGTLRLWAAGGAPLGELKGHTNRVNGALGLGDGRLLSWSDDGTLRLWSEHGTPLGALQGHTHCVGGALGLGDGRLLSWSRDGALRLWAAGGAPLQPWLWPYHGLREVIRHATQADYFWVLAGNDILLVHLCA